MDKHTVQIHTFQPLSVEYQGKSISEADNRSQKMWLLLAYILYFRHRSINQEELLSAIWNADEVSNSVLKTALHRLRGMLAENFGDDFGRSFIVCRRGNYGIDEQYEVSCDFEEFDRYLKAAKMAVSEDEMLELYRQAFEIYQGDFLNAFTDIPWVAPISIYYHNMYLEVVSSMLDICEKQQKYTEAISILRRASDVERYEETLYVHLIRNLIQTEKYKDAVSVYKHLNDMLNATFGVQPSKEAKSLYYEAMHALSAEQVTIDQLPELLSSQETKRGALYCEFEFFKEIYHAYARSIDRNGSNIAMVLISLTDLQDRLLSKRSLNVAVANLRGVICDNLRTGDIVSMCTPSQFVVLLPNADEENSEIAMDRIKKAFFRQYPHSPAKLTCVARDVVTGA